MSSTPTTTPAAPAAAAVAAKPARSFSVTLHGADGAILRLMAVRKSDGSATTYALHVTKDAKGKRHSQRGASEQHASFDRAKAALTKLATAAASRGWKRGERRGGFVPRPDSFSVANLPAAAAAEKKGRK
jgi:hypothetical protein